MSILINGMEMPKEGECFTVQIFRFNGEVICTELYCADTYPVIELPSHGRLIDADAMLLEAKQISGPITGDGWDNYGVYALIERQPTVIEAEGE